MESILDKEINLTLTWRQLLNNWATEKLLSKAAKEAMHLMGDQSELIAFEEALSAGDFSSLPQLFYLTDAEMLGAAGAYSSSERSIYLNRDWTASATNNSVFSVLTEELGHHIDASYNLYDSPGDEGEVFASLLIDNASLWKDRLIDNKLHDDHGNVLLDGRLLEVENAALLISTPVKSVSPGHTSGEWRNLAAFAALRSDGSVVTWGDSGYGGNSSLVSDKLTSGVCQIFSTNSSFAALKANGSVVTWGSSASGGDSSAVVSALSSGVLKIYSTQYAFAALKNDGSVVAWGNKDYGGDISSVSSKLTNGVINIFSNSGSFAALKSDGSVVTWGNLSSGGDSSSVYSQIGNSVSNIFSNGSAFVALKYDGSIVTWGDKSFGSDSSSLAKYLSSGVKQVFSTYDAFAALKDDGSVITWGESSRGGDSSVVSGRLLSGVKQIFSNYYAFAALKDDGSVVTWGSVFDGGDSSALSSRLSSGVIEIVSTASAFTALKSNGSVAIWGDSRVTDRAALLSKLNSGVIKIFSNSLAFAALKDDGSVVTWGDSGFGGDSSAVASQLLSGVKQIFTTSGAFSALKSDGSVVTWGDLTKGGDNSSVVTKLGSEVVQFSNPFTDDWLFDDSNCSINLDVSIPSILEDGSTNFVFTFTRTGSTIIPLTVNYKVTGTAILGNDYTGILSSGDIKSINFPSNASAVSVSIDPIADTEIEYDESVILTLADGAGYSIGTRIPVVAVITSDDLPVISLSVLTPSILEDEGANIIFVLNRTGPTANSLLVNFTISGSATAGVDYTGILGNISTKTVTFAANSNTAYFTLSPVVDFIAEQDEAVIMTLVDGTGYSVGTKSAVSSIIRDIPAPQSNKFLDPAVEIFGDFIESNTVTAVVSVDTSSPYINTIFSYSWSVDGKILSEAKTKSLFLGKDLIGKQIKAFASYEDINKNIAVAASSSYVAKAGFVAPDGKTVSGDVYTTNGVLENGFSTQRTDNNDVVKNAKDTLMAQKTTLNTSLLDFSLVLPNNPIKPAEYKLRSSIGIDLSLSSSSLSLPMSSSSLSKLTYYLGDLVGKFSNFAYDAISKTGASFYDLDGNSSPDFVTLDFLDGSIGDADGRINGKILVNNSSAAVVSIDPLFVSKGNNLLVKDPLTDSPAALVVNASLTSSTSSVNEICYVILNQGEALDTLSFSNDLIKRSKVLFANLESSGVPNLNGLNFQSTIRLVNGQSICFFECIDSSFVELSSNKFSIASLGSRFRLLSAVVDSATSKATVSSPTGLSFGLQLGGSYADINSLVGNKQGDFMVLDFSNFKGQSLSCDLSIARESYYNNKFGFYRITDTDGSVLDPLSGATLLPGSIGYQQAALASSNRVANLDSLQISNGKTNLSTVNLNESGLVAPYAIVNDIDTFFSFAPANIDGINHFRVLGANIFGLEDLRGGGDLDFDDLIVGLNVKPLSAA